MNKLSVEEFGEAFQDIIDWGKRAVSDILITLNVFMVTFFVIAGG